MSVCSNFCASVVCFFFSESVVSKSKKANEEHKRGLNHEDSLLQSLLIQAPVVTPYTTSSLYSIVTTRCFLYNTTLSYLLLDADSDAVALPEIHLLRRYLIPQRSVDVIRLQPNQRRGGIAYYLNKRITNNEMRAPPSRKRWQDVDCEARCGA